jgi:hypothetical protein
MSDDDLPYVRDDALAPWRVERVHGWQTENTEARARPGNVWLHFDIPPDLILGQKLPSPREDNQKRPRGASRAAPAQHRRRGAA